MQEKWILSSFQSPQLHLVKSWQLLREIQSPSLHLPLKLEQPQPHIHGCVWKVISRRSLWKADVLSCYYTLCPACSSSQHPFPTRRAGLGGVSLCGCNTDLHHHHLCICTKLNKQLTFWEQILLERTKTNSSDVWDPPLGSGEHIQNKAQVCRLPVLFILSSGKQFQCVSLQH